MNLKTTSYMTKNAKKIKALLLELVYHICLLELGYHICNLKRIYRNCLGKLRYRKGGSKILHSHEKYDGLLVLIWQKKCKKVEAYFTVIYKNTNHLYKGIHDKNSEILNIHYNTKLLHMQKKSVDIIWCF